MEKVKLKYGNSEVELKIENAKSVKYLNEKEIKEIDDIEKEFYYSVNNCVNSPSLKDLIAPEDKVTVVISDLTRFWMRQDVIVSLLVKYLYELGVKYENIAILIGLGTHRPQTEDELKKLVTEDVYNKVAVVNHDCDAKDLVYIGETLRNTPVWVNPLAVNRKVITIGGTVHHLMAGFGGGRKSILPGICGRLTINKNHMHSLSPDLPKSNDLIGTGALKDNPINEDMIEAARMVNPCFSINIVTNTKSKHCSLICGDIIDAWEKSCRVVQDNFGVPIEKLADIVVVRCGGFPKDISLYQSIKSLFNANQCVKDGGTIVFLAQCPEGGGADEFFGWTKNLKNGTLDHDLRADFTIAGYIFYAACEVSNRAKVFTLTDIDADIVRDMGLIVFKNIGDMISEIDFTGKDVYIMPYGGSTVPFLNK
jgi:nickel-dependent lactate racemase